MTRGSPQPKPVVNSFWVAWTVKKKGGKEVISLKPHVTNGLNYLIVDAG